MKTASKHQYFYFDVVRAFSAQIVVIGHSLNILLPGLFMSRQADGGYGTKAGILYVQNVGVVLFFVLSGFLVTKSVVRKQSNPKYGFNQYAVERFSRVFVPLVPAIILVGLLDAVLIKSTGSPFTEINLSPGTFVAKYFDVVRPSPVRGA